jgi:hypothetical protein
MSQDKQDEINLEIPLMGDYYSGAKMTLVLSDVTYNITKDFTTWYDFSLDILEKERPLSEDEKK